MFMIINISLLANEKEFNIYGIITDTKTGKPVIGAIVIVSKNKGVISNDTGQYTLGLPKGIHTISVSFMGYKESVLNINVKQNQEVNFKLERSTLSIDEVTVIGSSHKADIKKIINSPVAVTVVDGTQLRGRASGIEDVLTRTSGLKIRKSGGLGSSSRISIHGLEGKQVAVYIDGFPLNTPDGSFDINDIPIDAIKQIEVYKGIVPAEYGGDDLGGAINIVTRNDDCDLVGITQEFASYGTSKSMFAVKKLFKGEGIQLGLGGFYNRSDNNYEMIYPHYDPGLPNDIYKSETRNNDFYGAGMLNVDVLFTKLWFDRFGIELTGYKNKKGIQAFDFDSRSAFVESISFTPSLILEKGDFIVKNLDFKFDIVASTSNSNLVDTATIRHQWNGNTTTATGETSDNLLNLSDDKQISIQNRLNLKYRIKDNHTINLNNQFGYTKYVPYDPYIEEHVNYNPSGYPNIVKTNIIGLNYSYISKNKRFQNSISGKLYYLNSEIYDVPHKNEDSNVPRNANATQTHYGFSEGISYELFKGFRTKLSIAHSVRIPDAGELFGDGNLTRPSLELQPETSNSLNAGFIFDKYDFIGLHRLQLEANFYYMDIEDLITLQSVDIIRLAYANLGHSQIKGIDADLKVDITTKWYGYFNATYQSVIDKLKYKADNNTPNLTYGLDIPNIPRFYFNYGIEYHTEGLIGENELSRAYIDCSYVEKYDWAWQVSTDETSRAKWSIPTSHIMNIGIQQSFLDNQLSVGFEVENIFDSYSFQEFRLPLQGRTFKIKLRFNWFKNKLSGGAMGI